jgi:hypothetical protein
VHPRRRHARAAVDMDTITGWVGFAWGIKKSLRNTVHFVDRLELLHLIEDQYRKLYCSDSVCGLNSEPAHSVRCDDHMVMRRTLTNVEPIISPG